MRSFQNFRYKTDLTTKREENAFASWANIDFPLRGQNNSLKTLLTHTLYVFHKQRKVHRATVQNLSLFREKRAALKELIIMCPCIARTLLIRES